MTAITTGREEPPMNGRSPAAWVAESPAPESAGSITSSLRCVSGGAGRDAAEARGRAVVERTYRSLAAGDVGAMDALVATLGATRRDLAPAEWRRFVDEVVRPHPILPLV